jgi:hypothetical protein
MVTLALLTLFTIVGLTFVAYSDKEAQASENWRAQATDLLEQVRQRAPVVQRDLLESLAGDLDLSPSHDELETLATMAAAFRDDVCTARDAQQDPSVRRRLTRLCLTLQALVTTIDRLERLVNLIELNPTEQPA